jgi:hypothetical protein
MPIFGHIRCRHRTILTLQEILLDSMDIRVKEATAEVQGEKARTVNRQWKWT